MKKTRSICVVLLQAFLVFLTVVIGRTYGAELTKPLDRRAIVERHKIQTDDPTVRLPVGNGNLCFNADATGMQTFSGDVLSHWGWFSEPLPSGFTWDDVAETGTYLQGRLTGADDWPDDKAGLFAWTRQSPHQMNLARVRFLRADGTPIEPNELSNVSRELDPWTGIHKSSFALDGETIAVEICIGDDKELDSTVALRIDSASLRSGELYIEIAFPYPSLDCAQWFGRFDVPTPFTATLFEKDGASSAIVKRELKNKLARDLEADYSYSVRVDAFEGRVSQVEGTSTLKIEGLKTNAPLEIAITFDGGDYFGKPTDDSTVGKAPERYERVCDESRERWERFWKSGAAVDLSESSDPRWKELERRVVLSQFLLRTNSAGNWPSSEQGLLRICNWSGRFHMEMVWWHLIHWWTWDRAELADDAIKIYPAIKDGAQRLARQLGYKGYKWQKEVAPDGRTAPWKGNQALLWKQPHPIYFAEMDYRRAPVKETIDKWSDIVEQTAVHMADFPTRDDAGVYHLIPTMPPSEVGFMEDDLFDLAYWRWGLETANKWRERQGLPREALWDEIAADLAPLPVVNGRYVRALNEPQWRATYEETNWEHPDPVGVYGMVPPTEAVDLETARRSVEAVVQGWQWDRCWGWDFPWTAMCAARVGRPDLAIEILLKDSVNNHYDVSGACCGGPAVDAPKGPYLPGNGGLLIAIAAMCAGYDEQAGGETANDKVPSSGDTAPGFPEGWSVKWEGLKRPL